MRYGQLAYTYLLCDDNGVSNSENEILLPIGTVFRHEYGKYKVIDYRDNNGKVVHKTKEITQIHCERISK